MIDFSKSKHGDDYDKAPKRTKDEPESKHSEKKGSPKRLNIRRPSTSSSSSSSDSSSDSSSESSSSSDNDDDKDLAEKDDIAVQKFREILEIYTPKGYKGTFFFVFFLTTIIFIY